MKPPCSIEECPRPSMTRGWCRAHYGRWYYHGDPLLTLNPGLGMPLRERFWMHVDSSGGVDACWPWMASRNKKGYGRFGINRDDRGAHIVSYMLSRSVDTVNGMMVRHSCDVRPCCNPWHLSTGTNANNVQDRQDRGRSHDRRGGLNSRAKLTEPDVYDIRRCAAQGESRNSLARRYGVSKAAINLIVWRRNWSSLPDTITSSRP